MIRLYRYSEGERQFLMVDGRNVDVPRFRKASEIHSLCLLHQVDAIAIVSTVAKDDISLQSADYALECFSSEGVALYDESAARCSVAFADLVGIKAFHSQDYRFECMEAVHSAHVSSHLGECKTVCIDDGLYHETICMGEIC